MKLFPPLLIGALLWSGFLLAPGGATAGEAGFFGRFTGSWSGSGMVVKNAKPWQMSCHLRGRPTANRIQIEGNCNVAVVSREIGAVLTYNPSSGVYTGVYVGAKVGPARLAGKRVGDVVQLTVTWPKPVNGDRSARMTVLNTGDGHLRITVADNIRPGGPVVLTSDLRLNRS